MFLQEGGVITTCPIELVTGKHFQLSFLNYVCFFIKYFSGFFYDLVLAWNMLFSFSIVSLVYDIMSDIFCTFFFLAIDFLKISSSQLFTLTSASYKVVIYLKNFVLWLLEKDTLDAYTIPKINELCREKLISVILDYESAYMGLAGEVNYSQEVRFIRGIFCYPKIQFKSLCIWIRNSVLELMSLSLWILRSLFNLVVDQTFLQDIFLFYPIDWIPLVYLLKNWNKFDMFQILSIYLSPDWTGWFGNFGHLLWWGWCIGWEQ